MELKALMPLKGNHLTQSIYINWAKVKEPKPGLPNTRYDDDTIVNPSFFYLYLKDVAKFYIGKKEENSLQIDIELLSEQQINVAFTWLYGSILTAALIMLNRFALHSSGVLVNDKLHIFCGQSGIGKSTIAAQLTAKGYPLFTDDKCVVNWNETEKEFMAQPSLQIIRLWKDATDKIDNTSFLNDQTSVNGKLDKFQYQLEDMVISQTSKALSSINIIMNVDSTDKISIELLKGIDKIHCLMDQTHRLYYVKPLGKSKVHWHFLSELVNKVPVYLISRPNNTPIEDFVGFVEAHIKSTTQTKE